VKSKFQAHSLTITSKEMSILIDGVNKLFSDLDLTDFLRITERKHKSLEDYSKVDLKFKAFEYPNS
jgi:hypothetical protein